MFFIFSSYLFPIICVFGWSSYQDLEGNFSVLVPGSFEKHIQAVETDIGTIDYHTFVVQTSDDDNLLYMVSYCDYPSGSIHSDSLELIEDFFEGTIAAATESVDGELIYQSESLLEGVYPGKLWRIDYLGGEAVIKTSAWLVANRYYSIQTITRKDKAMNTSTNRFMDSFRLIST